MGNRTGQGTGSDSSISEDIDIYKGSENSISMSRLYNIDFFCDYDMRWYPFDAQTCFIIMKLGGGTEKLLSLTPGLLKYLGPEELTQYYVKMYTIEEAILENAKGLSVSITFGRRLLGTILTVYLPTVLLNVIGHATNFFKPFFFEAVVTVNLTAMLVLTTMFINVSNNLPKTSYVKMIDVWLIFNLLLPFIEVLVHSYMDTLREDEDREINHHGRPVEVGEAENLPSNAVMIKVAGKDLVSVDEKVQQKALKSFYDRVDVDNKRKKHLERCQRFTLVYNPMLALIFVAAYWIIGLFHAYIV